MSNAPLPSYHELRLAPRIRVRWHADAYLGEAAAYQGFIKDISIEGTDIFLDTNLRKIKTLKLRIYIPPLSKKELPHSMDVSGSVVYTSYDSNESMFHTGVKFIQFGSESDRTLLEARIKLLRRASA